MKTFLKGAIAAAALATMLAGTAQAAVGFYIGPDGARIGYTQGFYYDRFHHRQFYNYPRDWRSYHHPLDWYRAHPNWYRDRNWRR